jgi:hypothetical protein
MPYLKGEFVQLMRASFENEDCLLDVPFVTEEVDTILRKLKSGSHQDNINCRQST